MNWLLPELARLGAQHRPLGYAPVRVRQVTTLSPSGEILGHRLVDEEHVYPVVPPTNARRPSTGVARVRDMFVRGETFYNLLGVVRGLATTPEAPDEARALLAGLWKTSSGEGRPSLSPDAWVRVELVGHEGRRWWLDPVVQRFHWNRIVQYQEPKCAQGQCAVCLEDGVLARRIAPSRNYGVVVHQPDPTCFPVCLECADRIPAGLDALPAPDADWVVSWSNDEFSFSATLRPGERTGERTSITSASRRST